MSRPLAIDLFCGLGGWTEGLLAEGYDVIGFDIERHVYGSERYPAQLVLQDVRTIHGRQFRDASLIVASPPCQEYSYMAMPWTKAKSLAQEYRSGTRDIAKLTELFDACFRIQREACEAAGRHIPLVVENVRGAIPWVGRSRWNFGSFHLWGDVPALMPMTKAIKNDGGSWFNVAHNTASGCGNNPVDGSGKSFQSQSVESTGVKVPGLNWVKPSDPRFKPGQGFNTHAERQQRRPFPNESPLAKSDGTKVGGTWFHEALSPQRMTSSKSSARARASAIIAKIPLALSVHIARTYRPAHS